MGPSPCGLYEVLGVAHDAPAEELRRAFKRRALETHPDKGGDVASFRAVMAAFEVLSDAEKRARHDLAAPRAAQRARRARAGPARREGRPAEGAQRRRPAPGAPAAAEAERAPRAPAEPPRPRAARAPPRAAGCGAPGEPAGGAATPPGDARQARCAAVADAAAAASAEGARRARRGGAAAAAGAGPLPRRRHAAGRPLLERLFCALQQLAPERRREVIAGRVPLRLREALESWALDRRGGRRGAEPAGGRQRLQEGSYCAGIGEGVEAPRGGPARREAARPLAVEDLEGEWSDGGGGLEDAGDPARRSTLGPAALLCDADAAPEEEEEEEKEEEKEEGEEAEVPQEDLEDEGDQASPTLDLEALLCDADEGPSGGGRTERPWQRCSVRGISSHLRHKQHWYCANIFVGNVYVFSREVKSLERVLDFMVVLTAIRDAMSRTTFCIDTFPGAFRDAIAEACASAAMDPEIDLGLRFQVRVSAHQWIGRELVSPCFRMESYDHGIRAWQSLTRARGRTQRGGHVFHLCSIDESARIWRRVRRAYEAAWAADARSGALGQRLDALAAAHWPQRERQMERWNRAAMTREERLALSAAHAERARGRAERVAMRRAAAESRRRELGERRSAQAQRSAERRALALVRLWARRAARLSARARAAGRRERRRAEAERRRERAAARRAAALQRRAGARGRARELGRRRYRDLTMDEILRGRAPG